MALSIVHVLAPAPYGGLEKVVELLSRGQAAAGERVAVVGVFTGDPADHPSWNRLSSGPVQAVPLVIPGRRYLAERAAVATVLTELQADVLHTHGYRPDILHGPVGRKADVATISTVHGFTGGDLKNRFYEWMQCRALRSFDAVVAVSDKLRSDLAASGVSDARLHVIRNAWQPTSTPLSRADARARLGLPPQGLRIGWVGRLSPEKAPDVMLRAFAQLELSDVRLSLIGDGRARDGLIALAESLGVRSRVDLHGDIDNAGAHLRAFDALTITSHTEGTPMILFEAMAAGVPVVTTKVGGIPDVVSEREAWIVPSGAPAAVAERVREVLLPAPDLVDRVAAARDRLAMFDAGPWTDRYNRVYAAVLAGMR